MKEQRPSEVIEGFPAYLEQCNAEYDLCKLDVEDRSKRNIDYLHDMEFAQDKLERNRIATSIQKNQKQRRISKDRACKLECIAKFYSDNGNRVFLKALKRLVNEQFKKEEYIRSDRIYSRRVGDEE